MAPDVLQAEKQLSLFQMNLCDRHHPRDEERPDTKLLQSRTLGDSGLRTPNSFEPSHTSPASKPGPPQSIPDRGPLRRG